MQLVNPLPQAVTDVEAILRSARGMTVDEVRRLFRLERGRAAERKREVAQMAAQDVQREADVVALLDGCMHWWDGGTHEWGWTPAKVPPLAEACRVWAENESNQVTREWLLRRLPL